MPSFLVFRLPIVGAYRQPCPFVQIFDLGIKGYTAAQRARLKPPSPQQKTLYATQHKGFYCINSSRYINAPIICTSKILNTVIDGKIIA